MLCLFALLPSAAQAKAPTRYSLANGCFAAKGLPGAEQVRMRATALGSYLLYRPDGTFVSATGVAPEPSAATDWVVRKAAGSTFFLTAKSPGATRRTATFVPATGCATFPEAGLNATGTPARGRTSYGAVKGLLEGHMHWMTFQYFGGRFHCGAPWHPYGIKRALPDCASIEGPQGTAAPFQNTLNYGNPGQPHDTRGFPQMTAWGPDNLTYEGTYWKWIQRAWMSGLRVMVMGVNENRVLCELQTNRTRSCNEMDTVRTGFRALHDLEDYVDAQAGGPGKGFFEIVTDPYEARRVVNQGRMAVIQEIEISEPFDCRNLEQPSCDVAQVDRQLKEVHKLGVRSSLLLNKFDNPLSGVRFDSGATGVVINNGNKISAGSYWSAKTCTGPLRDNTIEQPAAPVQTVVGDLLEGIGGLPGVGGVTGKVAPSGTVPAYPAAPHCNTRGLTPLGRHVIRRMMDLGMIVNPDHMSQAGVDATLSMLEARSYSGVISPHGWMDPGNWPRLWKLGGLAFPGHATASAYVKDWRTYRPRSTPYKFGWGYGADLGGLSHQPGVDPTGSVKYPFKSYDGRVTFQRQQTGERTFDYAKDGVAHYGLYADWFEDLRRVGGDPIKRDMLDGAEAYLQMWERADGVRDTGCRRGGGRFTKRGRGALRLRADWVALLKRAGQPQQRGRAWSWCVNGSRNVGTADVAVLTKRGRVAFVGTTARRAAGPFRVGRKAGFKRVRVRGRFAALAQRGRVVAVGAATKKLSKRPKALRKAMRRVHTARANPVALPAFTPAVSQRAGRLAGRTLAGVSNPRLDRAIELLCSLQVQASS